MYDLYLLLYVCMYVCAYICIHTCNIHAYIDTRILYNAHAYIDTRTCMPGRLLFCFSVGRLILVVIICLRLVYASSMPRLRLVYASSMPRLRLVYASSMPRLCLVYASSMPRLCLVYASSMPRLCLALWIYVSHCVRVHTVLPSCCVRPVLGLVDVYACMYACMYACCRDKVDPYVGAP
jgi:hypothetical protein